MTQELPYILCRLAHRNTSLVILRCRISPPQEALPHRGLTRPHIPHVLPGGIQDEGSNTEDDKMGELCVSEFSCMTYRTLCQSTESRVNQVQSTINDSKPEPQREFQIGCWSTSELTQARRLQLAELMLKIYKQTAWMGNPARS